ncbi:unnamed protein product [Thelazia callipaeda]|uniref:E3 ubiquitin-protein ligase n=1 Tax=Thelazia callipaeda TaxID=103827 RepID=A0A0N5CYJ8_THECL|nr:unnamed protein product [Thelazia callipaeda]
MDIDDWSRPEVVQLIDHYIREPNVSIEQLKKDIQRITRKNVTTRTLQRHMQIFLQESAAYETHSKQDATCPVDTGQLAHRIQDLRNRTRRPRKLAQASTDTEGPSSRRKQPTQRISSMQRIVRSYRSRRYKARRKYFLAKRCKEELEDELSATTTTPDAPTKTESPATTARVITSTTVTESKGTMPTTPKKAEETTVIVETERMTSETTEEPQWITTTSISTTTMTEAKTSMLATETITEITEKAMGHHAETTVSIPEGGEWLVPTAMTPCTVAETDLETLERTIDLSWIRSITEGMMVSCLTLEPDDITWTKQETAESTKSGMTTPTNPWRTEEQETTTTRDNLQYPQITEHETQESHLSAMKQAELLRSSNAISLQDFTSTAANLPPTVSQISPISTLLNSEFCKQPTHMSPITCTNDPNTSTFPKPESTCLSSSIFTTSQTSPSTVAMQANLVNQQFQSMLNHLDHCLNALRLLRNEVVSVHYRIWKGDWDVQIEGEKTIEERLEFINQIYDSLESHAKQLPTSTPMTVQMERLSRFLHDGQIDPYTRELYEKSLDASTWMDTTNQLLQMYAEFLRPVVGNRRRSIMTERPLTFSSYGLSSSPQSVFEQTLASVLKDPSSKKIGLVGRYLEKTALSAIVEFKFGQVVDKQYVCLLKMLMVVNSGVPEYVQMIAPHEDWSYLDIGTEQVDIHKESRYLVYRKMSVQANIHLMQTIMPCIDIRNAHTLSYVLSLFSKFSGVFETKCRVCKFTFLPKKMKRLFNYLRATVAHVEENYVKHEKAAEIEGAEHIIVNSSALHCPICLSVFISAPFILRCGHSFCQKCIKKLVKESSSEDEHGMILCPICRQEISCEISFTKNYLADALLQSFQDVVRDNIEHVMDSSLMLSVVVFI